MHLRSALQYPLLARELMERASRRRTYIVRVLYGLVLYALFGLALDRTIQRHLIGVASSDFGFGYELLKALVNLLSWSLVLVQPALMAGALASEKERNAFGLLLLTRLTPGKIFLEKYLGGLFPTATLLLLALPLAAITMGYGGVSPQLLLASGIVLLATWLMVGAWALLCSAWCRTTLGALLLGYLGGACVLFAAPLVYSVLKRDVLFGSDLTAVDVPAWLWALWPTEVFNTLLAHQSTAFSAATAPGNTDFLDEIALRCAPLLIATAVFLLLGRALMLPRASSHSRAYPAWLACIGKWALLTRKRLRLRAHDLPGDAPVVWREHTRSPLGSPGQFFYVGFVLCVALFALCLFLLGLHPPTNGPERLHKLGVFIACVATFVLVATSVTSLLSEQSNATLDILLTTPVGIDQLLREKAQAIRRYWILFGCMLGIVFGVQGWSEFEYARSGAFWRPLSQYWATALLALVVYPPLLVWSSFLLASWWRKKARTMFAVLAIFAVWAVAPLFILRLIDPLWRDHQNLLWWSLLSPIGILDAIGHDRLAWFVQIHAAAGRLRQVQGIPWVPVAINFAFYIVLAVLVRWFSLRYADRLLRK